MKTSDVITIILVCIVFGTLGFLSGKYPILDWIYVLVYFCGLYLVISKRHKMKPRWASLIGSFLLPGLGQVVYAKQWLKMVVFLTIVVGGPILSVTILATNLPAISFGLMFLAIGVQIYNLIDAYNIGKKAEK